MISFSLVLCFVFACLSQADAAPKREKRALWELDVVISCYTGRSGFDYNGYGCWCGLGGSGRPVDDTDACCMAHDYCYQALMDDGCGVYFTSYDYSKRRCSSGRGEIVCAGSLADPDPTAVCHFKLCECDRQIASCLARYQNSYRNAFANYEKRLCDPKLALPAQPVEPVVAYQVDTGSSNSSTSVVGAETGAYQQVVDVAPQGEMGANDVPVDGAPEQGANQHMLDLAPASGVNQHVLDEAPAPQSGVYQQMFDVASRINAQQQAQLDAAPETGVAQQVLNEAPNTDVQNQQAAPVYRGVYRQVKHKSKTGPLV